MAGRLRKWDHNTPAYVNNDILRFTAQRDFITICLLANILKFQEPAYLACRFEFLDQEVQGSKRCSALDLKVQWARISFCQKSFLIGAANLWNELPVKVRLAFKNPHFKTVLLTHMLRRQAIT